MKARTLSLKREVIWESCDRRFNMNGSENTEIRMIAHVFTWSKISKSDRTRCEFSLAHVVNSIVADAIYKSHDIIGDRVIFLI